VLITACRPSDRPNARVTLANRSSIYLFFNSAIFGTQLAIVLGKDVVNFKPQSVPQSTRCGQPLTGLEKGWCNMLSWALTFLVIALIAAVLGFGGIAGTASSIAQVLFFVFLVLFIISLIAPRFRPPVA
jgi:uncharacterized membrane protein YtjA (UPF0391 family)